MFGDFNGYTTAQITRAWVSVANNQTIVTSGGRFNQAYMQTSASNQSSYVRSRPFSAIATGVIGFSWYGVSLGTDAPPILSLLSAGVEHIRLVRNADGTISITRAGTALTSGTSSLAIADNTWAWIELKWSIANSIGASAVQLWINGTLTATVATGQDTQNAGTADVNSFWLGKTGSVQGQMRYGEFYVDDGTTPLGDCRVETLAMTGNGTTQDFTSSSGGHYTDVDDATADDDSTYVESATVNHVELFTVANLSSTPTTINAVSVWNCVEKTDAGPKQFAAVVRQSGTNYTQATTNATDDYQYDTPILLTDPATASAWTESGVNSIEAGLKVIA